MNNRSSIKPCLIYFFLSFSLFGCMDKSPDNSPKLPPTTDVVVIAPTLNKKPTVIVESIADITLGNAAEDNFAVATDNQEASKESTTNVVVIAPTLNKKPTVSVESIADITLGNTTEDSFTVATDNQEASKESTTNVVVIAPTLNKKPTVIVESIADITLGNATEDSFALNATAADIDGSISAVAFYLTVPGNNTEQLINTDKTAPFTASVTNLVAGTYTIRVVATDNQGASKEATNNVVVIAPILNKKPTVSVESIADITLGNAAEDSFALNATAADIDGSVSAVAFYATAPNTTELLISTDTTAPYSTLVTANAVGVYSFRVVATDNDGATSQVTGNANAKNSNQGEQGQATEDFGLSYVNDTTMRIYHVDNNWTAGFNYLCINSNCQAGIREGGLFYRDTPGILGQSYNLEFKVQDNVLNQYIVEKQNVVFSAGNTNTAPMVNLTATLDATIVSLSATASDADGSVSAVKFYVTTPTANEIVISNDSSAPFAASYTTTESGVFNFRAVATDDQGATSEDTTTITLVDTEPAASLSAPATINENESLTIAVALQNWTVEQGDTHYHYFINGEDQGSVYHTNNLVITDLSIGSHFIEVKLAEADHSFTGVEATLSVDVQDIITSTVSVVNHPTLGNILVAGSEQNNPSFTLYTFDNDNSGQSVCEGGCATTWPPLTVTSAANLVVPTGVTGLSTLARSDGTLQVTLNGENLYYFANDNQTGDVNGHGANGVWWAADLTVVVSSFTDNTWQKSVVPACSDLYAGNTIPNIGYHIYTENNTVVFKAGIQFATNVWADEVRTVFFRNNAEGRLVHLGTVESTRNGTQATMQVPSDWLQGESVYYVSYERQVAPQQGDIGNALAYQDSALYGLNKSCVDSNYNPTPEVFAGWVRFQHPQGFFNDHNVFNERIDPVNNSVGHFKNLPRFVATVLQDEPGKDLLIRVDLTYEKDSTMSATDDITWAAIEGSELRAGGGSPRQQISFACEATDASYNSAICNLGQSFAYGQNIDWELRVIPRGSAGSNLYSQMLFYVKGHGWVRESVDPRATLGGYASIDAFGANVYERTSSFMQHNHTDDLQMVRDFVEQHEDFRVPIGDDVNPGFHTCESCHVNDGRSQVVFDVPNVGLRIAPPLIGLGLLEKVEFAGKAGFGWQGNRENVEAAVRFALGADFGVTSPEQAMVDRLTHYSKQVAVPQRDKSKLFNTNVIAGEALFKGEMQCAACHTESQITNDGDVIRPFSDLLTHDLGKGLFRTAPLWGIGRTPQVAAFSMDMEVAAGGKNAAHDKNQREFVAEDESTVLFMHDGSALGLDAAVRAHNGEAAASKASYESANIGKRQQLLEFLRSL